MAQSRKLMCVLAHPDDETLGIGGTLAKYAAEGVETYLITATRGERGWFGAAEDNPGLDALGEIRQNELRQAADALGIREVRFLDYVDGDLDQAAPDEAVARIAAHLRRIQPDVVITFDPFGAYGHPDHIAICQLTSAAIVCAAEAAYQDADNAPPHAVSKLYYRVGTAAQMANYQRIFGELKMHIGGEERRAVSWPEWAVTTCIDVADYWDDVWKAITCHQTQLTGLETLRDQAQLLRQPLWQREFYYRVFSRVNGSQQREADLFDGLRKVEDHL
jgi:LmbE family N-acetylglucosaminyl deacetylase